MCCEAGSRAVLGILIPTHDGEDVLNGAPGNLANPSQSNIFRCQHFWIIVKKIPEHNCYPGNRMSPFMVRHRSGKVFRSEVTWI